MSFLKRFDSADQLAVESPVEPVLRNLRHILNAKRGYGSILEDFGIADLSHCASREALVEILTEQIRQTIERYEPRVTILDVIAAPNERPSQISMVLTCVLKAEQASFDLVFDAARSAVSVDHQVEM